MNITRFLVLIALTSPSSMVAAEDSPAVPAVDTSNWKCDYCEFEEGWSGEIELGLGNVSDDSYKFGEYTGLNEKGAFFIGNADLYYRNPNASFLDLSISDSGLDSRSLSIEGGKQGSYKLFFSYDELPRFTSSTASTPYTGSGSGSLSLPGGWVTSGTTTGMTALTSSLRPVDLSTQRTRIGTGLSFTPGFESSWKYAVNYHQDKKEGNKRTAGSFYFNAAQLIEPVDYVTEQIDVSATYNIKKWQASLSYYGSTFRNSNASLIWQNAYTPFVTGADTGELALPPDNQFNQILVSAGYELSEHSRISGDIAVGRMEQNDDLLAVTQTASLMTPLPATSANAEVDTMDAKLRYMSRPTDKLHLSASYTYNDRDNKTPQLSYDWVSTDSFVSTPRTNLPYSFTQNEAKLSADYQIASGVKLGAGYDLDKDERTYQDIEKTTENTLWGRIRVRSIEKIFFELKIAEGSRDTSAYQAVSEIDPAQNVLLRKYNMADRDRTSAGLHTSITPEQYYTIGLNLDFSDDDYSNSQIGLIDARDFSANADLTTMLSENTSLIVFIGQQQIQSSQAGSDWTAKNDDTVNNIGLGMTHVVIEDKLDIGADYTKTRSTGRINVSTGSPSAFPDLKTELTSLKIYANYRLQESMQLHVAYWYESYNSDDWAIDNVSADTIPGVLSLGETSPAYNVNAVTLSLRYKF